MQRLAASYTTVVGGCALFLQWRNHHVMIMMHGDDGREESRDVLSCRCCRATALCISFISSCRLSVADTVYGCQCQNHGGMRGSGCNGWLLARTRQWRRERRVWARIESISRTDQGCRQRVSLGELRGATWASAANCRFL